MICSHESIDIIVCGLCLKNISDVLRIKTFGVVKNGHDQSVGP